MENESNSLLSSAPDFRTEGLAFGISGETVARMSQSAERALACLNEARRKGAGPGLAVHMFDAGDWPQKPRALASNLVAAVSCEKCDGDRFVVHRVRVMQPSGWMRERGLGCSDEMVDEMKPCPDCNPDADVGFWRADGRKFVGALSVS